jgi:type II secretory pathway pseudopilin PulG
MLEMVITVMVLGVLFGITALQLDSVLPDARLKKQVRLTVSMIELASNQAVVEGMPLALTFDRSQRTMVLDFHETEEDESYEILEEEEDQGPLFEEQWPEELDLVSLSVEDIDGELVEAESIVFLPEGSCDGAVLRWQESSGLAQEMELWPLLGKVSLSDIDDSQVW